MTEMNSALEYLAEARDTLQKTAQEQDLVDGGDGRIVYRFTLYDAMPTDCDWGGSGDRPDRNVRVLFNSNNQLPASPVLVK